MWQVYAAIKRDYWRRGDLNGARAPEEEVLVVRRRVQGEEHPDTLTARNNLAATLRAQGEGIPTP